MSMEILRSIAEGVAIYIIGTGTLFLVFKTGCWYYGRKFRKEFEAKQR